MQQLNMDNAQNAVDSTFYDRFAAIIFQYLLQRVSNEQDAEDLLLEVFLAALKDKSLSNLPAGQQLAWLKRVARNKVIDRYRHVVLLNLLPIEQALELEDIAMTPEQNTEQQESYERLYQSIAQLTSLQRELIRLRYSNGLRFFEIAAILEKPEGTVRQLFGRTLCRLPKIYDQLERGNSNE
ncbi:MAG TPA: sigma-70 family RNA polymerase sigma factor [Ktedonobacteraceae bacterium]